MENLLNKVQSDKEIKNEKNLYKTLKESFDSETYFLDFFEINTDASKELVSNLLENQSLEDFFNSIKTEKRINSQQYLKEDGSKLKIETEKFKKLLEISLTQNLAIQSLQFLNSGSGDPETAAHINRVYKHGKEISEEVFADEPIEKIVFNTACLVHDIGKAALSLKHSSDLTPGEIDDLKNHNVNKYVSLIPNKELKKLTEFHHIKLSEEFQFRKHLDSLETDRERLAFIKKTILLIMLDSFDGAISLRSYRKYCITFEHWIHQALVSLDPLEESLSHTQYNYDIKNIFIKFLEDIFNKESFLKDYQDEVGRSSTNFKNGKFNSFIKSHANPEDVTYEDDIKLESLTQAQIGKLKDKKNLGQMRKYLRNEEPKIWGENRNYRTEESILKDLDLNLASSEEINFTFNRSILSQIDIFHNFFNDFLKEIKTETSNTTKIFFDLFCTFEELIILKLKEGGSIETLNLYLKEVCAHNPQAGNNLWFLINCVKEENKAS